MFPLQLDFYWRGAALNLHHYVQEAFCGGNLAKTHLRALLYSDENCVRLPTQELM